MDTLPTEIMMFRELRESVLILSEEDAAAVIRISRARRHKNQRLNHRGHRGHRERPQGTTAACRRQLRIRVSLFQL